MTIIARHSKKTMNLMNSVRWILVKDIFHFAKVNSNTLDKQDVPKKLRFFKLELTLVEFII
jgi:hypothetical protein